MRNAIKICRCTIFMSLLLVLTGTMCPAADKNKSLVPDDYSKILLKFIGAVEKGEHQGLWGNIKRHIKTDAVMDSNSLIDLIKSRQWQGKSVYSCEIAAYRAIGDNINQAYVLVMTDQGPFCWKVDLFQVKKEWYLSGYTIKKGVDMIGGGYEMFHLLAGKKSDVVKVEDVTSQATVTKDVKGAE